MLNSILFAPVLKFSNGKLKIKLQSGRPVGECNIKITEKHIKSVGVIEEADFCVKISPDELKGIKRLFSSDVENDVLYLDVKDKEVSLGESNWKLSIGEVDFEDMSCSFNKKYFKGVKSDAEVQIYNFDRLLYITNGKSTTFIMKEYSI